MTTLTMANRSSEKLKRSRCAPRANRRTWALLGLALVVGALLRLIALDRVPPGLQQDEAMNGIDAFSLGLTGRDHFGHPFPIAGLESYGDWVSPLLTFLSAPVIRLAGPQVVALRAVAAVVGLLAIPATYWCGRVLTRRRDVAVLAAWFLALAPAHVHLSRFAIPPVTVPTLIPLLIASTVLAVRRGTAPGLTAAGALAGLAVLGYPTLKLLVPLLVLAVVVVEWRALRALPLTGIIAGALAFLVIAGPSLYLSTIDPAGRTRMSQVTAFDGSASPPIIFLAGYLAYFKPSYLFGVGDGNPTHGSPFTSLLLWSLVPLLLLGLARLLAAIRQSGDPALRRGAALLLAALFLAPVPGAMTVPSPHTLRGSPLIPLGLLICAVGAAPLLEALARNWQRSTLRAIGVVVVVVVLLASPFVEAGVRLGRYFTAFPAVGAAAFSAGIADTLAWIAPRAADYDEVWLPFPYNYYLFYQAEPPSEVQARLQVQRVAGEFDRVPAYGRYHFGTPPAADVATFAPQATIRGSDGAVRYEIGAATAPDGRHLLVARLVNDPAAQAR